MRNMSLTLNLSFPQPAAMLLLPSSTSTTKPNKTTLPVNPSSSTTQNRLEGSNLLKSAANIGGTQPLIEILRGCDDIGSVKIMKSVHGFVSKSNLYGNDLVALLNHILRAYSKCAARKVFDGMSERNVFSWTVMIVGSTENGLFSDGLELFKEMVMNDEVSPPDKFVYTAVIQTCIGLDCAELGKMVHAQIIVRGLQFDGFVGTSLLNMYAKFGEMEESSRMFKSMEERTRVSWNALISGLTSNGLHREAYDQFLLMKKHGVRPNSFTLVSVSKAVAKLGDVNMCKFIHSCASEFGVESSVLVGTALIDMYSNCKSLSDAKLVFE